VNDKVWCELDLQEACWYESQLGDLCLYLMKKGGEYITATMYQPPSKSALNCPLQSLDSLPESIEAKERLYLSEIDETPVLDLQLADKPYEVKPAALVKIAPKSRMTLYVSTPLWLQFKLPHSNQVIVEFPTVQPRMSWVGRTTTEGSLCYSTRTSAPSSFTEVRQYPHRVLTALELVNDGEQMLSIDRLSLPLNSLSLYHTQANGYWTESVRFQINPESGDTTVIAADKPPEELGETILISRARNPKTVSRFRTAVNLIVG
jgi:hypothetical protein